MIENEVIRARSGSQRNAEIQAKAERMGVDEAYISLLVDTFYERIQANEQLGPIFAGEIKGDWTPHLDKMKSFWASATMNTGSYDGRPVPAHMKLQGVEPEHFQIWLGLFEQTLRDTAPSEEAVPYFLDKARMIAQSLQFAMFGLPNLPTRR